jgi:hypothetical protein
MRIPLTLVSASLALCVLGACSASAWASEVFGVEGFTSSIVSNTEGAPAIQAGSHPYALTTAIVFNHVVTAIQAGQPPRVRTYGDPKDIEVNLPAGVIVDPRATEVRCTEAELEGEGGVTDCPNAAAVGVFSIYLDGSEFIDEPVYDMSTAAGVPAELGFDAAGIGLIVHVGGRVRTGADPGMSADFSEIPDEHPLYGLELTLWGDPSAASHDEERGACAGAEAKQIFKETGIHESCPVERTATPLLTMPGSCTGEPLTSTMSVDSWQEPGSLNQDGTPDLDDPRWQTATASSPPVTGCDELDFSPKLEVKTTPESPGAESPAGLEIDLETPHEESEEGLAGADLKQLTVALPPGMAISPSVASGLGACTPSEIALHSEAPPSCPKTSILGGVEITTPLLEGPLKGAVYLAQPETFEDSLIGLYVVAEGHGVLIKLGATAALDPSTGQVTLTLENSPQLPIEKVELNLFGGSRAPLQTPPGCGRYIGGSDLVPWNGTPAVAQSSTLEIDSGPNGGACPNGQFSPSFIAGTTNSQAGAFSPLSITITRRDGEQRLRSLRVTAPPGLLGALGSVTPCSEPQASTGSCPPASEIGEATLAAGPGPDPYWLRGGHLYLTGSYAGAPFGLAIVTPALAGPFDLGDAGGGIVTRARVEVDSHTAQITIESNPGVGGIPVIEEGIPLDIRAINLTIGRPGFIFNPTSCAPLSVTGSLESTGGANVGVVSPFEAAGCASLSFKPKFTASAQARTSRLRGASLSVQITSGPGQANVGKVRVILPKQLPARLTTLQKACPDTTFNANPASCPAASAVGMATAVTRLLAHPLTGPAYLVAHGGIAFPDLVFVLQGEGVVMYLDGNVDIKKSFTSSTFNSIPDVPIATFTSTFPEGPHSILASDLPTRAKGSMCGQRLTMPTAITGQNGALQTQSTKIAVSGCPKRPRGRAKRTGGRGSKRGKSAGKERSRSKRPRDGA